MSLRDAAKKIGVSRLVVRSLVDRKLLRAFRVGGRDSAPWLAVYEQEARAAYESDCVYHPKAKNIKPKPVKQLHPAVVAAMRD